jgi:uncharacterized protein YciI
MFYVLRYFMVDDFEIKREKFRSEHLAHIRRSVELGKILVGGACGVPIKQGLIIFKVGDQQEVHDFVAEDVYFRNGIVFNYEVNEWHLVVGADLLECAMDK